MDSDRHARLAAALKEVEHQRRASEVFTAIEDPDTPDAVWCLEQYFVEINARFETGFDPSQNVPMAADELRAPIGALCIARFRNEPIGCGALKIHPAARAEIKHLWVAPEARGLGAARRILKSLEQQAKALGARVVQLDTNRVLREAILLYRNAGYHEVPPFNQNPYAHYWFEKTLS